MPQEESISSYSTGAAPWMAFASITQNEPSKSFSEACPKIASSMFSALAAPSSISFKTAPKIPKKMLNKQFKK